MELRWCLTADSIFSFHTHMNTDDPHLHTAVVISEMGITFNNQRRTSPVALQGGKLDKLKDEAI